MANRKIYIPFIVFFIAKTTWNSYGGSLDLKEIRIQGRGGQGAVTSGQILATAAFYDNKECQTFPMFGVERSGAPVQTFVRISSRKINLRTHVYEADITIVLEPSLVESKEVREGMKKNSLLIINTNKTPEEIKKETGLKNVKIYTVDATKIAFEIFNKAIVNTPILGAFAKITGLVTLKSLKKAIDDVFLKTKGKKIAGLNKKAVETVYKITEV